MIATQPSEWAYKEAKRLRLACLWLEDIAKEEHKNHKEEVGLSRLCVEKIKAYEEEHLESGDLMAIRTKPGLFHPDPYNFLWALHRYQNTYMRWDK